MSKLCFLPTKFLVLFLAWGLVHISGKAVWAQSAAGSSAFEIARQDEGSLYLKCSFNINRDPAVHPVCNLMLPFGVDSVEIHVVRIAHNNSYVKASWFSDVFINNYTLMKIRNYPVLNLVFDPNLRLGPEKSIPVTGLDVVISFYPEQGKRENDSRYRSTIFEGIVSQLVLNPPKPLYRKNFSTSDVSVDGAQFLIIAPDVYFNALEPLKDFRMQQGISTRLVGTSETGTTVEAVENYIDAAYNTWTVPPEAILLVGDAGQVPVPLYMNFCLADNIYADVDGDGLPDMIIGRLPMKTQIEVQRLVTRIIDFENNPPDDDDYYRHPSMVADFFYFGHSGWMLTEILAGWFDTKKSKETRRAYMGDFPPSSWPDQALYNQFGPDGLGYIPEDPAYVVEYGGGTTDTINMCLNQGSMMITSASSAMAMGWMSPDYYLTALEGLQDAPPSLMFSDNSLTGKFDNYPEECLAEAYLKNEFGGIGVVASSIEIFASVRPAFTVGFFDGLWDDFYPDYQMPEHDFIYPARALAYAKYFLQTIDTLIPQQTKLFSHEFHYFGDPYTVLVDSLPQDLQVDHGSYISPGQMNFSVTVDSGAVVALVMNGEICGVQHSTGEPLIFDLPAHNYGDTLHVTATRQNFRRYHAKVPCNDAIGINSLPENHFGIFPNPAGRYLEVQWHDPAVQKAAVRVISLTGTCMADFGIVDLTQNKHLQFHVENLAAGLYFLEIETTDKTWHQKFVIEHQ